MVSPLPEIHQTRLGTLGSQPTPDFRTVAILWYQLKRNYERRDPGETAAIGVKALAWAIFLPRAPLNQYAGDRRIDQ